MRCVVTVGSACNVSFGFNSSSFKVTPHHVIALGMTCAALGMTWWGVINRFFKNCATRLEIPRCARDDVRCARGDVRCARDDVVWSYLSNIFCAIKLQNQANNCLLLMKNIV